MSRRLSIILSAVSLLIALPLMAAPVCADDIKSASFTPPTSFTPREMAHCMLKRFRANHSESHRDAYKACKEQFDAAQADGTETAMNEAAPAGAGRAP